MAIGTPVNRGTAGGTTTATVSSFAPTAGDTLIAWVTCRKNTSAPAALSLTDSLGGSWTQIFDQVYDPGSNPRMRLCLYTQVASGSAMTVTATISDAASIGIQVSSISGVGTDFTNIILNTNLSGDPSCTLPNSPGATSAVMGFYVATASNLATQVAGYTELIEFTANSTLQMEVCYDISSPAQTVSWTSTNTLSHGIGLELKEPSSGGVTVNITGVSATASVGNPTVTGAANVPITGVSATASVGTATATGAANVAITGVAASASVGDPTVTGAALISITGVSATASVGNVTVNTGGTDPSPPTIVRTSTNLIVGICL